MMIFNNVFLFRVPLKRLFLALSDDSVEDYHLVSFLRLVSLLSRYDPGNFFFLWLSLVSTCLLFSFLLVSPLISFILSILFVVISLHVVLVFFFYFRVLLRIYSQFNRFL